MSPSSSGSWSGARGADIIDLDRYMRGAVRPSRPAPAPSADPPATDCELVVDAGGVKARHKRFSHDSGVSDSSYSRRRRHARPHRRPSTDGPRAPPAAAGAAAGAPGAGVEPSSTRTLNSSNSLRAFRTVCEQALLEQQRQIAHVAQLCERLTERTERAERAPDGLSAAAAEQRNGRSPVGRAKSQLCQSEKVKCPVERRTKPASTADVSELSSSTSRSTKDPSRKDRHRTQQCKTYKIIMSKLDELNRLFSSRAPPAPPPRRRAPSSSSVTVCDKLVATDPALSPPPPPPACPQPRSAISPRPCSLASRRVTRAFSVDIAPLRQHNVVVESMAKCESDNEMGSSSEGGDPRCGFDLEDPVHLYAQSKKLQTLTVTTGRERTRRGARGSPRGDGAPPRSPSLCAACRDYWRSLRDCLLPQLFSQPLSQPLSQPDRCGC